MRTRLFAHLLLIGLALAVHAAVPRVKNVIVMISDGCGFNQIAATGLYRNGATGQFLFEEFPVRLAMSTYSVAGSYDPKLAWVNFDYVRKAPTDSAAAATAMATGIKSYDAAIGVDVKGTPVTNILQRAEALGKSTGAITTVEFSHATPAGFVAHNPKRDDYEGIAREMLLRSATDVVMGCGHPGFDNDGKPLAMPKDYRFVGGKDTWEALLAGTAGADADGNGTPDPWTLLQTREAFQALATSKHPPTRVCGVAPAATTLQQARGGDAKAVPYAVPLTATVPTLSEMALGTLNVLGQNRKGFVLMIEGGAIDWASHANQSGRVIEEESAFVAAVEAVAVWVKRHGGWKDTLLIVTGDHETGYLTGPGSNPVWNPLQNNGVGVQPGMQWNSGGHTNSLIPFFAKGAGSDLFLARADNTDPVRGRYLDNTSIAAVVFQALR
jgi:alkaline phosphatase